MAVEESVAPGASATASVQEKASAAVEVSTNVASNAAASAKEVASEAASQVGDVVAQSKQQLGSLVDQTKVELSAQLDQRASQAATGLNTLSTQLQALAEGRTDEAGALADYVRDAQQRVQGVATRLDERGAQGLLEDVTAFARRRPVAFLAATAAAGFVVGRVVRAGGAAASNGGAGRPTLGQASIGNGAAAIGRSPVAALSETVDRPYAGLDTGTSAR